MISVSHPEGFCLCLLEWGWADPWVWAWTSRCSKSGRFQFLRMIWISPGLSGSLSFKHIFHICFLFTATNKEVQYQESPKQQSVRDTLIGSILDENLGAASLIRGRNPIFQTYLLCEVAINSGMGGLWRTLTNNHFKPLCSSVKIT